jgi:FeS assembly SUF system regulator
MCLSMLHLTRKCDYALVAMAHLAEQDTAMDSPISARQVAEHFTLPVQVLVKVLKDLHRAGIIGSTRGARGGYYLEYQASQISIADVIDAIEGPIKLAPCCQQDDQDACVACSTTPVCPISNNVRLLNDRIRSLLRDVTLQDLMTTEIEMVLPATIAGVEVTIR